MICNDKSAAPPATSLNGSEHLRIGDPEPKAIAKFYINDNYVTEIDVWHRGEAGAMTVAVYLGHPGTSLEILHTDMTKVRRRASQNAAKTAMTAAAAVARLLLE